MSEAPPRSDDRFNVVQPHKHFIVRLPSENFKVLDLKPNSSISLGKFGVFSTNELIGKPFGPSWEILPDKKLKLLEQDAVMRDNRNVFDDGRAQQLSSEEILEVRKTMSSKDIISTITANNINFDKKNVFSQEKYVRSKEQRFLRAFTPIQPNIANIIDFLWSDRRERCMDLSIESLALMMLLANVCAGGRYLVIDETGILTAAILERGASVFVLCENQQPYTDLLKYLPHLQKYVQSEGSGSPSENTPTFHSLDFLSAFHPDTVIITTPIEGPLYERKMKTYNMHVEIIRIWNEGGFDGFLSATPYDPTSYIGKCSERVGLSGNIVVYSQYREAISELQNHVMTKMPTRPILAPTIHEIRATRWNTSRGRARPDMLGRGGGGWIFSGTRVEEGIFDQTEGRRMKKRKVESNGTEMEGVNTDGNPSEA